MCRGGAGGGGEAECVGGGEWGQQVCVIYVDNNQDMSFISL